jgi:predicted signal transduction protein with EAL and GGDEF domain
VQVGAHRLVVTLSVGLARASEHGHHELLRDADLAMYAAKEAGKNQYRLFDEAMRRTAMRRHLVGQALRGALRADEFRLVYQPKVDTVSRACVGFEALLRWQSKTLGDVAPSEFIPIAEDTGVILDLGAFVLRGTPKDCGCLCPLTCPCTSSPNKRNW